MRLILDTGEDNQGKQDRGMMVLTPEVNHQKKNLLVWSESRETNWK